VDRLGVIDDTCLPFAEQITYAWPNFAQCLLSPGHLWGLFSPNGILPGAKFTLHPSLHSPTLAALLHGTRAVGISLSLWHSAESATYI